MTVLAAFLALAGFMGLALAMERHQRDVLGRVLPLRVRRGAAVAGWSTIAVAHAVATFAWGLGVGTVVWIGLLSLAAMVVLLTLSRLAHP